MKTNYDNYKASYKYCKNILSLDFNTIHSLEKLQKYKVILLDSYRYINNYKELGLIKESIERGFIIQVPEISLDSFVPKDLYMSTNIKNALEIINNKLEKMYKEDRPEEFSSGTYKGIYYCVMDDCDENKGGYYIEFHRDLQNEYGEIDFDERLDYMVIHVDDEYEMSNPKKVVEEHIDNLIIELEKRNEEIQDEETI